MQYLRNIFLLQFVINTESEVRNVSLLTFKNKMLHFFPLQIT